jgi:hypothetical protein
MKTITMPMNIDPVYININGVKYEYRAGQTYEVPDEVASVIENVIANEPKTIPVDDFATKDYVDTNLEGKLNKSGGAMTGNLNLGSNAITNVNSLTFSSGGTGAVNINNHNIVGIKTPTVDANPANKKYVDDSIAAALIVDTEEVIP